METIKVSLIVSIFCNTKSANYILRKKDGFH